MHFGSIEIMGNINQLAQDGFKLGKLTVKFTSALLDRDFNGSLAEGQYVQVTSIQGFNTNNELIASEIDLEGDGRKSINYESDEEEIEQKGVITEVVNAPLIQVNGSPVVLNATTQFERGDASTLQVGQTIEMKATLDTNGNLVAKKIELKDESYANPQNSNDDSGSNDDNEQDKEDDD